ncbi:uncharacterized protein AMSG_05255 [Thecamonas trahens ATCC 50062]|uniref:U-box domain-containing protein n=1 Tax=Thecamonas trahens ATCC 50062 TaxID=461836 RepID=A0A0L0DAJ5_THETB|nr:hypothetical protein AMSG_05255 [Thecamonas trahens ATCC 50062]KNC49260.1 hypothetical protein AMSG_05255 [Thecamonas trahens ATCC 50062]|eukprot:XP_013757974.1 hypothetical protein AMSG_05255 [Thecamonas trahens ATCC 50062]
MATSATAESGMQAAGGRHRNSRWEELTVAEVLGRSEPRVGAGVGASGWLGEVRKAVAGMGPGEAVRFLVGALTRAGSLPRYPDRQPERAKVLDYMERSLRSLLGGMLISSPAASAGAYAALIEACSSAYTAQRVLGGLAASFGGDGGEWDAMVLAMMDTLGATIAGTVARGRASPATSTAFAQPLLPLLRVASAVLAASPQSLKALAASPSLQVGGADEGRSGAELERTLVVGPWLAIGALDLVAMEVVFDDDATGGGQAALVYGSMAAVREGTDAVLGEVRGLVRSVLKADKDAAFAMLEALVAANAPRGRIMVQDTSGVSSRSLCFNLGAVLTRLCEPFARARARASSHLAEVDGSFVATSRMFKLESETLLAATNSELEAWVDVRNASLQEQWAHAREELGAAAPSLEEAMDEVRAGAGRYSGTTRLFFLGLRALHQGPVALMRQYMELSQQMSRARRNVDLMEATGGRAAQVQAGKAFLAQAKAKCLGIQAVVLLPTLVDSMLELYGYAAEWLVSLMVLGPEDSLEGQGALGEALEQAQFPLGAPHPLFAILPEHMLEDVVEVVMFVVRVGGAEPHMARSVVRMLPLLMVALGAPRHVKNPYLRARIAELLFLLTPGNGRTEVSFAGATYEEVRGSVGRAFPASLVELFVEIEASGGHSSFYDKFSVRHHIAGITLHMWRVSAEFRAAFGEFAVGAGQALFVKFANAVMNDATFAVDESIGKFERLNELAGASSAEDMAELDQVRGSIQMFIELANDSVGMLEVLCGGNVTRGLLLGADGLQSRVARLLNHMTALLLSEQVAALRVSRANEIDFDRRSLLRSIAMMFGHMGREAVFVADAAADERNCKAEHYAALAEMCRTSVLLNESDIVALEAVFAAIVAAKVAGEAAAAAMSEAPDEFLDALTYEVMHDPVLLPQSGMVCDRSTIVRQLLSDPTDPWTKTPLRVDDLVTQPELPHPPYIPMDDTAAAAAVVAHFGLDGPSGSEPSPVLPAEAEAEYPSLGQVQGLEEEEREQVLLRVSGQALRCLRFTAKLLSACQAALGLPHDAVEDVVASGMTLSGDGADVSAGFVKLGLWRKIRKVSAKLVASAEKAAVAAPVAAVAADPLRPPVATNDESGAEVASWWMATFTEMFGDELDTMRLEPGFNANSVSVLVDSIQKQLGVVSAPGAAL